MRARVDINIHVDEVNVKTDIHKKSIVATVLKATNETRKMMSMLINTSH